MNLENLNTSGEIIGYGLVIVLEGILVVFLVLTLIMLVIYAISVFSVGSNKKTAAEPSAQNDVTAVEDDYVDETELIAVLTAAVAACMDKSVASVNIKSYKKVSRAWGNAAKQESLNNKI